MSKQPSTRPVLRDWQNRIIPVSDNPMVNQHEEGVIHTDTLFSLPEPVAPKPHDEKCLCAKCCTARKRDNINPCLAMFGNGPEGARCEDCVHLQGHRQSATWYKCDLRIKGKPGSGDHRVRWPACKRFERREVTP